MSRPRGSPSRPSRTCIGCRRATDAGQLVRVVCCGGELVASRTAPGRGAWLCRNSTSCLALAAKRRSFGRALRVEVTPEMIERLTSVLTGGPTDGLTSGPTAGNVATVDGPSQDVRR